MLIVIMHFHPKHYPTNRKYYLFPIKYQNKVRCSIVLQTHLQRLAKFNLEVEQEKTHILPFGRYKGTNETFDFLGFTHYNSVTHTGKYTVGHKVSKKKKKLFRQKLTKWVKNNRGITTDLFMKKLNIKLTGTFRFYGISGTMNELQSLRNMAFNISFKWINRRSQRKSYTRYEYGKLWQKYIEPLKIYVDIWGWENKL